MVRYMLLGVLCVAAMIAYIIAELIGLETLSSVPIALGRRSTCALVKLGRGPFIAGCPLRCGGDLLDLLVPLEQGRLIALHQAARGDRLMAPVIKHSLRPP